MFDVQDYNLTAPTGTYIHTPRTLPPKPYLAVAIASHSLVDQCLVDGKPVGVGAPLLLDGKTRTLRLERTRLTRAPVSLLLITDPRALAFIPTCRAPVYYGSAGAYTFGVSSYTETFIVAGRRHVTITARSLAIPVTFTVRGTRRLNGFSPYGAGAGSGGATTYGHNFDFYAAALAADSTVGVEVGGTDNEECWDEITLYSTPTGAGTGSTLVTVEAYGELGVGG